MSQFLKPMKLFKLKSYCKINLSLRIIKKLKNNFHKIQSFIIFCKIHDEILIKENNMKKDLIKFNGEFKNNISKSNNTILNSLNLLRNNNYLKEIFFDIKIKKNIPSNAGFGGGSMNSSTLLSFLNQKYKLKIINKKMINFAAEIGSDVPLGLKYQNKFYDSENNTIKRINNKINLFLLIVKPNCNCSTKLIFSKNKKYSVKYKNIKINGNIDHFKKDTNDLEIAAFKLYPKIKELKSWMNIQKKCQFSRMTGSGSACVAYFKDLKSARKAKILIKKKFPKYWCKLSKAM